MPTKLYRPEEMVTKLRQVDVLTSYGWSIADAIGWIGVAFANGKCAAYQADHVLSSKLFHNPKEMVMNCSNRAGYAMSARRALLSPWPSRGRIAAVEGDQVGCHVIDAGHPWRAADATIIGRDPIT